MNFIHLNIRKLLCDRTFDYVRGLLLLDPNAIFAISEMWLQPDYSLLLEIEGFRLFCNDRGLRRGAVLVHIPEHLYSKNMGLINQSTEPCWVQSYSLSTSMSYYASPKQTWTASSSFADDTAVYAIGSTVTEATEKLSRTLSACTQWFIENHLVLNRKKCVAMITTIGRGKQYDSSRIMLSGKEMKIVQSAKYLGVTIDSAMKWTKRFNSIKRNVCAGIAATNYIKNGLPVTERIGLYNAFVQPHLEYCASV